MESSDDEEIARELDEDGVHEPYVKPAKLGSGLGLFANGKPKPIEYKRDTRLPNQGFLTAAECDELWSTQSKPCAQYMMEVGLDTQWYRDEVDGCGALRPITELSRYTNYGQQLDWDEDAESMVLTVRGDRNIYIPLIDPTENPAAFANDACFGVADPSAAPETSVP